MNLIAEATAQQRIQRKRKKKQIIQTRYRIAGIPIAIEQKKGAVRSGIDPDGNSWKIKMKHDYGFIPGSKQADGMAIDVYVNRLGGESFKNIYIIHQHKIEKLKSWPKDVLGIHYCPVCSQRHDQCFHDYDEDKVMIGFSSLEEAKEAYLSQYDSELFLGPITTMSIEEFKRELEISFRGGVILEGTKEKLSLKEIKEFYIKWIDEFNRAKFEEVIKDLLKGENVSDETLKSIQIQSVTVTPKGDFISKDIGVVRSAAKDHLNQIRANKETLKNDYTGWNLSLSRIDVKKIAGDYARSIEELRLASEIKELAKKAIPVKEQEDYKKNKSVISVTRFIIPVQLEGENLSVMLTVKSYLSGDKKLHALEGVYIEPPTAYPSESSIKGESSAQPAGGSIDLYSLMAAHSSLSFNEDKDAVSPGESIKTDPDLAVTSPPSIYSKNQSNDKVKSSSVSNIYKPWELSFDEFKKKIKVVWFDETYYSLKYGRRWIVYRGLDGGTPYLCTKPFRKIWHVEAIPEKMAIKQTYMNFIAHKDYYEKSTKGAITESMSLTGTDMLKNFTKESVVEFYTKWWFGFQGKLNSKKNEPNSNSGKFAFENISEKAFVLKGDTFPIKEHLGKNGIGGIFKPKYKGWMFPLTRKAEVIEFMKQFDDNIQDKTHLTKDAEVEPRQELEQEFNSFKLKTLLEKGELETGEKPASNKEAAKLIREQIKELVKNKILPKAKYSVRTGTATYTPTLDVSITGGIKNLLNPRYVWKENFSFPYEKDVSFEKYTKKGQLLIDALKKITDQYTIDNSDSMIDYFDVNWYACFEIDYRLEGEWRDEISKIPLPVNDGEELWQQEISAQREEEKQEQLEKEKQKEFKRQKEQERQTKLKKELPQKALKLEDLADKMENQIDAKLNPAIANQNMTSRRASIALSMETQGENMQKIQSALRLVAERMKDGTLPEQFYPIVSKKDVERLLARSYKNDWMIFIRKSNIDDYEKEAASSVEKKGILSLKKLVNFKDNEHTDLISPLKITDTILKSVNSLKKRVKYGSLGDSFAQIPFLKRFNIKSQEDFDNIRARFKEMVDEVINQKQPGKDELEIRRKERELIGQKIPGFFPTPSALVSKMLKKADIKPGMKVLEPSAGKGDIAENLRVQGADVDVIEIQPSLQEILTLKGFNLVANNFLSYNKGGYDRIIMNPPFEGGQDMIHIQHAYKLLKAGGKLISVISEGPFFREDKKTLAFREWLNKVNGNSVKNEAKSFTGAESFRQTGVNTRIVEIEKGGGLADLIKSRERETPVEREEREKKAELREELEKKRAVATGKAHMLKIIEALQTTHNLETYKHKFNEMGNIHFTKLNTTGTRLLIEREVGGHIISSFTGTPEEVKKELFLLDTDTVNESTVSKDILELETIFEATKEPLTKEQKNSVFSEKYRKKLERKVYSETHKDSRSSTGGIKKVMIWEDGVGTTLTPLSGLTDFQIAKKLNTNIKTLLEEGESNTKDKLTVQEVADALVASFDFPANENHYKFAQAIVDAKDGVLTKEGYDKVADIVTLMANKTSRSVFQKFTQISLPNTVKGSKEAIDEWAIKSGLNIKELKEQELKLEEDKIKAEKEAKQKELESNPLYGFATRGKEQASAMQVAKIEKALSKKYNYSNIGIKSRKEFTEHIINQGGKIVHEKRINEGKYQKWLKDMPFNEQVDRNREIKKLGDNPVKVKEYKQREKEQFSQLAYIANLNDDSFEITKTEFDYGQYLQNRENPSSEPASEQENFLEALERSQYDLAAGGSKITKKDYETILKIVRDPKNEEERQTFQAKARVILPETEEATVRRLKVWAKENGLIISDDNRDVKVVPYLQPDFLEQMGKLYSRVSNLTLSEFLEKAHALYGSGFKEYKETLEAGYHQAIKDEKDSLRRNNLYKANNIENTKPPKTKKDLLKYYLNWHIKMFPEQGKVGRSDYEERKEAKIEYYERKSQAAQARSNSAYNRSEALGERFYMGQPILVGHHSEKGARSAQKKMWNAMDKSIEESNKADYYTQKAESAENNKAISSDDPEVLVKLKVKVEQLEKQRETMKLINKTWRKYSKTQDEAVLRKSGLSLASQEVIRNFDPSTQYSWEQNPIKSFQLTNLGAEIRRVKKRIEKEEAKAVSAELGELDKTLFEHDKVKVWTDSDENRTIIKFDKKVDKEFRKKLKDNGFRWAPSSETYRGSIKDYYQRPAVSLAKEYAGEA